MTCVGDICFEDYVVFSKKMMPSTCQPFNSIEEEEAGEEEDDEEDDDETE